MAIGHLDTGFLCLTFFFPKESKFLQYAARGRISLSFSSFYLLAGAARHVKLSFRPFLLFLRGRSPLGRPFSFLFSSFLFRG
jgi:hypothetical protein